MRLRLGFLAILLALFTTAALAQSPGVTAFSGGSSFGSVDGTDQTLGYSFTPNLPVVVSALGYWDGDTSTDLASSHQVGIWTSTGTLVASATVLTNSPATGSWRYASITPVTLLAGTTYVIGSAVTTPYSDPYNRIPAVGGSVTTNSLITIGTSRTNNSAGGFSFPSNADPTFIARLGPNLLIAPSPIVPISKPVAALIAATLLLVAFVQLGRMGS